MLEASYKKSQKDEIFINEIHYDWSGSLPLLLFMQKIWKNC